MLRQSTRIVSIEETRIGLAYDANGNMTRVPYCMLTSKSAPPS